jgi:hypothetical protein
MSKKNTTRKTKNFARNRATHHPNSRLLLGISAIGILVIGAVAILGTRSETLVADSTNSQTPFLGLSAEAPN